MRKLPSEKKLMRLLEKDPELKRLAFESGVLREFQITSNQRTVINTASRAAYQFLHKTKQGDLFKLRIIDQYMTGVTLRRMPDGFNAVVAEWYEIHWYGWLYELEVLHARH